MSQKIPVTPVEKSLIEHARRRLPELPGGKKITTKRKEAFELLLKGFPDRNCEFWHYTDLRRLISHIPDFCSVQADAPEITTLLEDSFVLSSTANSAALYPCSDGAVVSRLFQGNQEKPFLNTPDFDTQNNFIEALNTIFVSDGFCINLADGCVLSKPLEIQNFQSGIQAHTRLNLHAGKGTRATIIERQSGACGAFLSSVSDVSVDDEANIDWFILHESEVDVSCLSTLKARLGKNARFSVFLMNMSGKLLRQEIKVRMTGSDSSFYFSCLNLLSGNSYMDVSMILDHAAPQTSSRENIRNVVLEKSHGIFQGSINVHQVAQKTDAKMSCNTLLLSDEAQFSIKPELEIFADDVSCAHGATVSDIDENHLFYLMSRGIDEKSGRELLVKSFAAEIINNFNGKEQIINVLHERLDRWFKLLCSSCFFFLYPHSMFIFYS